MRGRKTQEAYCSYPAIRRDLRPRHVFHPDRRETLLSVWGGLLVIAVLAAGVIIGVRLWKHKTNQKW